MKTFYCITLAFLSISTFAQTPCLPPGQKAQLNINNIVAAISNGGQMWTDQTTSTANYSIDDSNKINVLYAGNIGLGGLADNGDLHLTAESYSNNQFYPGPLQLNNAQTEFNTCDYFDRVWKINRWEVEEFVQKYQDADYTIPEVILNWPAHGNVPLGYAQNLAPFHDNNNDGLYDPYVGDYPEFDLNNSLECDTDKIYGDQCIYRIFNDVGVNQNTGNAIGVEIHAQAFAYVGGESINNTTFYYYKIINRSSNNYHDFYFANWTDSDIGCSQDDYVGSEVPRGIGYTYNADDIDNDGCNGASAIGVNPPAIGIDFVKGPFADINDSVDNDRDGQIDEAGERFSMSFFRYFDRTLPPNIYGDPQLPIDWYYYFTGYWRNGSPITYNGDGYDTSSIPSSFCFPGSSDTTNWFCTNGIDAGGPWSEITVGNPKGDRRMLQGVGPFTFLAGETKEITFAAITARDMSPITNNGNIRSVEKLFLADDTIQRFVNNCYQQDCPNLPNNFVYTKNDKTYHFGTELVATNYLWDFGDGSYSNNRFPSHVYTATGTYTVCLNTSNACSSILHCKDVYVESGAHYYFPYNITRIEGEGNGGRELELTESSLETLFLNDDGYINQPEYKGEKAPILVENIDNDAIVPGEYFIQFINIDSSNQWKMYRTGETDTVYSDFNYQLNSKQYIPQWGLAVTIQQYKYEVFSIAQKLATPITSEIIYPSNVNHWLGGLSDTDHATEENWIASGEALSSYFFLQPTTDLSDYDDFLALDNDERFENIIDGTFSPFKLVRSSLNMLPVGVTQTSGQYTNDLSFVHSVDVVFTNDTSKWTRCPVLEMQPDINLSQGAAEQFSLRNANSVNKLGTADGTGIGMSWFPGYAINVETGERLNMAFGEDSHLIADNGNDMLFNPTSRKYDSNGGIVFGGKHYLYVFENKERSSYPFQQSMPLYDNGEFLETNFTSNNAGGVLKNWRACSWVGIPMPKPGEAFLNSDARVRIRVKKPLEKYNFLLTDTINHGNPMYRINVFTLPVSITSLVSTIFPNPSSDEVKIEFRNDLNMGIYLKVVSLSGLTIDTDFTTEDSFSFNISSYDNGMYLYYIYNSNGALSSAGKFVKQ